MRRKLFWTSTALSLFLIQAATIWYTHLGITMRLERESASNVVGGLQVRIKDLKRLGDKACVTFVLEWVGERGLVSTPPIRVWGQFCTWDGDIRFYDSRGGLTGDGQHMRFGIPDHFMLGPPSGTGWFSIRGWAELTSRVCSRLVMRTECWVPASAKYVSLELTPKLVTSSVPVAE